MKRKVVVIDDLRSFPALDAHFDVIYARTSAEGLELLKRLTAEDTHVTLLLLDHDLGMVEGKVDDIMPVVDMLAETAFFGNPFNLGRIIVHSANRVGARSMQLSLERFLSCAAPLRRTSI